jgi:hypothetical protein
MRSVSLLLRFALPAVLVLMCAAPVVAQDTADASSADEQWWDPDDPRIGLEAGWYDAESAAENMRLLASDPRPDAFVNPNNPGDLGFANSDIAFRDNYAIVGNFMGFMIYDISDPAQPNLETTVVCPGGQGDVSIYGDLIFMSVEEARGRLDCGTEGTSGPVDEERFRGVRIFDVSDMAAPQQIAAVQTCRGSHTHTILDSPADDENLYVYVSGTGFVRSSAELDGCSDLPPSEDSETSLFQIEVIQVPLDAPETAEIVSEPRIFQDQETGNPDGLWPGGRHGEGSQRTRATNRCHDITVYPEIGRAAGACSGNGILLDITDPANPVRVDAVADPNFAFWHSATFSNDGETVLFTDEWGGGVAPRCQADDPRTWGANAFFRRTGDTMEHASYYKIPAPQTETENCVAHNGSLIPVPGRDIKVQAWYQGGVSVFDFTDPSDPYEIAFFDRGPMSDDELQVAGYWSTYWYNGRIYGTEIARGFDVFELEASEHLTENELAAAQLVSYDTFNPQHQPHNEWPADFAVVRAYLDQVERHEALSEDAIAEIRTELDRIEAERDTDAQREALTTLAADLTEATKGETTDPMRVQRVADATTDLASSL